MQGIKKVMKLMPDIDTIAILLCSKSVRETILTEI